MSTRNVVLTDHQNTLIDNLIASGRYQNASEAMRAGLRLLEEREASLHALRDHLAEGIAQVESGAFAQGTPEEIFDRAMRRAKERASAG